MRWWYEAIVRGMGGYACDPTTDIRCKFNTEAYNEEYKWHLKKNESKKLASKYALEAGLKEVCPACRLFGCTGWRRQFKLETSVDDNQIESFNLATLDKKNNYWWLSKIFEKSIKSDNSKMTFGKFSFVITELTNTSNPSISSQIHSLLSIMSTMGAIGAKNQYGYGIFDFKNKKNIIDSLEQIKLFLENINRIQETGSTNFYSLDKFWCYEFTLAEDNETVCRFKEKANIIGKKSNSSQYIPVSFDIRYKLLETELGLRNIFLKKYDKQKTRQIFGTINKNEKIGSRIFVSHIFRKNNTAYFLKIWGFTDEEVANFIESATKDMFGLSSREVSQKHIELKAFFGGCKK